MNSPALALSRRRRKVSSSSGPSSGAAPRVSLPTLRDVAAEAGVSTASVSRAINTPDSVSDTLRLRVSEAVGRLGYVANGAGRTLASRRSGLIGVMVSSFEPGQALLLEALALRLASAGYFVVVCASSESTMTQQGRALIAKGVEGLVLTDMFPPQDLVALAASRGVPCVVACGTARDGVTAAGLDLTRAAETVTRYLYDVGHRRFALLVPPVNATPTVGRRASALRIALDALPDAEFVRWDVGDGDGYREACIATATALRGSLPTAIICPDDPMALGSLHACQAAGIPVPGAVSIVGFGDSVSARQSRPPLTTLREPVSDIGTAAAEALLSRLAGGEGASPATSVKLIVRGTSGIVAQIRGGTVARVS